jgi:hypothetical protein
MTRSVFYQFPAIIAIDTAVWVAVILIACNVGVHTKLVHMMYTWIVEVATSHVFAALFMSVTSGTLVVSVISTALLMSVASGTLMTSSI